MEKLTAKLRKLRDVTHSNYGPRCLARNGSLTSYYWGTALEFRNGKWWKIDFEPSFGKGMIEGRATRIPAAALNACKCADALEALIKPTYLDWDGDPQMYGPRRRKKAEFRDEVLELFETVEPETRGEKR